MPKVFIHKAVNWSSKPARQPSLKSRPVKAALAIRRDLGLSFQGLPLKERRRACDKYRSENHEKPHRNPAGDVIGATHSNKDVGYRGEDEAGKGKRAVFYGT